MIRSAAALVLLAAPASAEITMTDSVGRTLTFAEPPTRVVALYNEAFGQMASLGIRPVATLVSPEMAADEDYYFEDGASIPLVGNMDGSPDPELVASFEPDLVIGWNAEEAATMEGIAPFYATDGVRGIEGVKDNLRDLGTILGIPERAEAAIADFEARAAAYAAQVPGRPTVLKLGAEGADRFFIASVGDPACLLLDLVATCEWASPDGGWSYQATAEAVLALDPDVIVLGNWSEMDDADFWAALDANPLWGEIRAVQEGRVVSVPGYSNPIFSSIAAGEKLLDTLIPAIFPEAFPDGALTDEQVAAAEE